MPDHQWPYYKIHTSWFYYKLSANYDGLTNVVKEKSKQECNRISLKCHLFLSLQPLALKDPLDGEGVPSSSAEQIVLTATDLQSLNNISSTPSSRPEDIIYPSSNNTGLLVLKPAVVNLGSQVHSHTTI